MRGTVKWFNEKKGFGFLVTPGHKDIFVHFSNIQSEGYKTLNEGAEVEFELEVTPKGEQAKSVKEL